MWNMEDNNPFTAELLVQFWSCLCHTTSGERDPFCQRCVNVRRQDLGYRTFFSNPILKYPSNLGRDKVLCLWPQGLSGNSPSNNASFQRRQTKACFTLQNLKKDLYLKGLWCTNESHFYNVQKHLVIELSLKIMRQKNNKDNKTTFRYTGNSPGWGGGGGGRGLTYIEDGVHVGNFEKNP